jgi:drug/metabolite transporter (DMT)-like permease
MHLKHARADATMSVRRDMAGTAHIPEPDESTGVNPRREIGEPGKAWHSGLILGMLGMLAFSGTLPATRLAVPAFGPIVLTCSRILIAAALGAATLWLLRTWPLPARRHIVGIAWTGVGLAIGYPLFVALAVERVPAAHGAVVIGLAPAATAILSVIRTGERPPLHFWIASAAGIAAVLFFAMWQGGGNVVLADAWLLAATISVGIAYVEGGRVSRELGGTVTLCWAMILLAPAAAIVLVVAATGRDWPPISWEAWAGFAYAGIISMFLGSVAWYAGLATGGIARIGQLNLIQPLIALGWAALLLGEQVSWPFFAISLVVLLSVAVCVRSRVRGKTNNISVD